MPAIRGGLMLRSVRCENLDRVEQAGQGHYRWSGMDMHGPGPAVPGDGQKVAASTGL